MLVHQLVFKIRIHTIEKASVGRVIMDANFNLIDKMQCTNISSFAASSEEYQTLSNYKFNYGCNSRITIMITSNPRIIRTINGIHAINCYCITWFRYRSFSIELVVLHAFMNNYYCYLKMETTLATVLPNLWFTCFVWLFVW